MTLTTINYNTDGLQVTCHNALNIANYEIDGFKKVCNVSQKFNSTQWEYKNIDQSIMYSPHKSWVYFIVDNNEIVKVGESGNPLGIRKQNDLFSIDPQPISGSKSRLGRYIGGSDTDEYIRDSLKESVENDQVSVWAKKCDYVETKFKIWDNEFTGIYTSHKDLEKRYIDHIEHQSGSKPRLNKGRA